MPEHSGARSRELTDQSNSSLRFALAAVVPQHLASANLTPEPRRIRPLAERTPSTPSSSVERDRAQGGYAGCDARAEALLRRGLPPFRFAWASVRE